MTDKPPIHAGMSAAEYERAVSQKDKAMNEQPKLDVAEIRRQNLEDITRIQLQDGNWNHDVYMFGLANGLILARATIMGEEPAFLEAPETWLCDRPETTGDDQTEAGNEQG